METTSLIKHSLVEVQWFDAISRVGWFSEEEFMQHEPSVVATVGYFICEDTVDIPIIRLASSLQDDEFGDSFIIPKSLIWSITPLFAHIDLSNVNQRQRNSKRKQRLPTRKGAKDTLSRS